MSAAAFAVNAAVTVIPENETLYIGGAGSDPANNRGGFIIFNPGSTLVVTQSAAKSVWAALVATNGAATVRFESAGAATPMINGHVFARGAGSLALESSVNVGFGHSQYCPVLDIENLTISGGGQIRLSKAFTALRFPAPTANYLVEGGAEVWL